MVSAAVGTQFELLACQTPSLLLVVADNQLNATEQSSQQGWCVTADARAAVDFNLLARQISEMWGRQEKLKLMCAAAKQNNSVEGAQRVVEAISELVKIQHTVKKGRWKMELSGYQVVLHEVTQSDIELIRQWRNDPNVSQYMLSQDIISQKQQLAWFKNIQLDTSQQHFVIHYKGIPIGVANIRTC